MDGVGSYLRVLEVSVTAAAHRGEEWLLPLPSNSQAGHGDQPWLDHTPEKQAA